MESQRAGNDVPFLTKDRAAVTRRQSRYDRYKLEMWAIAQRDGRPAEFRWRPLFNAAKFG